MSKVSSDELRIKEMQEAQRKNEVRNKEADRARQSERSFRDTMTERASREGATRRSEDAERRQRTEGQAKRVLDQVRKKKPALAHELAKRAALARAFGKQGALTRRAQESQGEARVLHDRAEHYHDGRRVEGEHVEERLREEDVGETEVREERLEEVRRETEGLQLAEDLARERRRERGHRDRDREEHRGERAEGVQAPAAKATGAAPPVIPPEMLRRIASAILKVAEDGRTALKVRLQGPGLEGVEVEVRNEDGHISCAFSGCSDRLRRDLERATPALGEALARRGFTLGHLEAS